MTSPRLVVGGIIVDDLATPTRVLAARRTTPAALRGKWEFPGGKVEDRESPEDALVRELAEELGIVVALGEELVAPGSKAWNISDDLEMRLWFAVVGEGMPSPVDSHDEIRWLGAASLGSVDWLAADLQVLPQLLRHL